MKFFKNMMIIVTSVFALHSQAAIITANVDTSIQASVVGDSAWLNEDTFSDGIDFFILNLEKTTELSLQVAADIAFGVSVYAGAITNDFAILFDNDADFSDFEVDLTYIDGMSALLPGFGNPAFTVSLEVGIYTIALGGNAGFMDDITPYEYSLTITDLNPVNDVNAPTTIAVFALTLVAIFRLRNKPRRFGTAVR